MPRTTTNSPTKNNEKDNRFRARLIGQLLVIFIALSLLGIRIGLVLRSSRVTSLQIQRTLITIPFLVALALLVVLKWVLFKKLHNWILKYSDLFDLLFALVFTAEWLISLDGQLSQPKNREDYCYSLLGFMTYGSWGWRALLQILISQRWQIRIIAPTAAWIFITQFAVRHDRPDELFILLYGIFQMFYIILIFYFDSKMNFTFTIGNIQQQQWLQLNEFILNNVPENIAIMDLNGECQFINENFRKVMNRRTQADQVKQFLQNITDIQKQRAENESDSDESRIEILQMERSNSTSARQNSRFDTQEPATLAELVTTFGNFIQRGLIKERSLYSFNGKFKGGEEDHTEERSFQINVSFIHYQPYKYILLLLRDTTNRDMVLSLKGDMKYKDHLLASVSHELRTPLNGNINMIEAALRSKDISDKIKETLLQPAVRSSKFLLYLVNDILDNCQIKAQKLRLVFQQSSLKETLINTLQLIELHAKKKGIELQTNIDPTLPDSFCTDHARLSQIILNLMNNSIKFTQSGFVKLSAWPNIGTDVETDQINISIEDSGIGMSQADRCKLFKDFTHIDSKDRERINPTGVGLGLKIANDLAKLLGPTGNAGIVVDSIINKGSIFSFVIENKETGLGSQRDVEHREENKDDPSPLIPNEINIATESSLQMKIAKFNSLRSLPRLITEIPSQTLFQICSCARVLVVDDDPFNIMAYEVILSSLGIKYESVYNGRSAIDKMLNKVRYPCCPNCHPYKVVFMDEEMPVMNGRETVEEIRRLQNQGLLPQMEIMGCTAHHDKEKIDEFLQSGITEYVSKPISFDTIKRILDKYDV